MATSSIIENIRVNNPQLLEDYIDFMEARANEPVSIPEPEIDYEYVTDPERIRRMVEMNLKRQGLSL